MSANVAPNVVRNGLVLDLDAANQKSYPGTGTGWSDLTPNGNNGTLTNGPTFNSANGGSIVFDGVDDYVLNSTITYSNYNNNFTAITWVKANVISGGIIGWGSAAIFPYYTWVLLLNNNSFRTQIYNGTNYYIDSNVIEANKWYNAAFVVYQSGLMELYINNVKYSTVGSSNLIKSRTDQYDRTVVGISPNFASLLPLNGNIANVQIYNRALSAAEILQNYNAQKSRFGL